jgi:hypothetical protein
MKFLIHAVIALSLTASAFSQSPTKVLKQAEKALGGSNAIRSIRSMRKAGTIKRLSDGAEGRFVLHTSQPNLLNISYDIAGFETEFGYNGRSAWSRNSRDGLQTLTGRASSDLQTAALFRNNLWLNAKNEKSKLTSGGQATIDGKAANIVLLATAKGGVIKLAFDAASGLPIRDEMPFGDTKVMTEYSDYRNVGNTKQAFMLRMAVGDDRYEIRLDDVRPDVQIARSGFDFPQMSGDPLPDIPKLLSGLQANEDKVEDILDRYSFTQKTIIRELGKDGILREKESETHQLSFYKGFRIRRLTEKNGKPLSEKQQADADKDAAKQVDEIEKRIAKNESHAGKLDASGRPSEDSRRISIAEVLRASKLINPRRERFRGREVVVFDFEPNPDFDTKNAKSLVRFFGKTAGVMWIDVEDKQVARLEAWLLDSVKFGGGLLAKFQKGAAFTLEKERVNDEIWLPSQVDINFSARVLLFKGIDLNQVQKFYDYRKFETEVKDAKVGEEKSP